MKKLEFMLVSAAASFILIASQLLGADRTVDSKITAVTVYRDRAIVTRSASVDLPAGSHRLVFRNIPLEADENSLRASSAGRDVTILGLTHQVVGGILDKQAEKRTVEAIDSLNNLILPAFDDRLATLAKQKEMLEQFIAGGTQALSGDLSKTTFDAQNWESAYLFISKSLSRVVDSIRVVKQSRDIPNNYRLRLAAQLDSIRSVVNKRDHEVAIDVETDRAATCTLTLEYMVPRATWAPLYNARFAENGQVEISYFGQVAQTTGEDWTDVQLTLSTAQPWRTATPGELNARAIVVAMPLQLGVSTEQNLSPTAMSEKFGEVHFRGGRDNGVSYVVDGAEIKDPLGGYGSADAAIYSGLVAVSSEATAYSTQFVVNRKESIPSGDKFSRIPIAQWALDGEETLIARTQNQPYVFRSLKLTNKTGIPFLPGRFNLFVGGALIGTMDSPKLILADQEFDLPFGIEDAIEVKREILNRKQEVDGDKRTISETVSITLTNHATTARTINLEEALPVSSDNRVKVDIRTIAPQPDSTDKQQRAKWAVKLAPGAKTIVTIDYKIEFPGGMAISGM